MVCCKEELKECSGACEQGDCQCAVKKEMPAEESSCCGGGCSDCLSADETCQGEMACCDDGEEFRYSNGLDAGKFFVLSLLSMSAYQLYWMYRNWSHIKEYTKKPMRPVGRTVAALFPILDIAVFCLLITSIFSLTKKDGRRSFSLPGVCIGYSVLLLASWAFLALSILFTDPAYAFVLFFFQTLLVISMTLILLPVQMALNDFWKHEQRHQPLQTSYTNGEIAWIVVGGLFLLLSLVSFFLPSSQPSYDYFPTGIDNGVSYSRPAK